MNLSTSAQNAILNSISWNLNDFNRIKKNNLNVMSTFSCGGGSSMGYKLAGCNVIAANDIDPQMAWHYKKNLNPQYYFLCPIRDLLKIDLPKELFSLDILDGSPPCSTFSMIGNREKVWSVEKKFREGQAKQVLSDLFFDFIDLVEYLKPKVVVAENVHGMTLGNAKGYLKMIYNKFIDIGYKPQLFTINANACSVPQSRKRIFFCCLRNDIDKPKLKLSFQNKVVTVGNACKDLQKLTINENKINIVTAPKILRLYDYVKRGCSFEKAHKKIYGKSGYYSKIRLNQSCTSPTLTSNSDDFYHWDIKRKLTYREWKRIGTFPDDYIAKSENIGKYMVGMSVPPKMTARIAIQVIEQWL